MSNATKTNLKLEILLSTMNRTSLDFLTKIFPNGSYKNYNLLIINQTTEDRLLKSKYTNSCYGNLKLIENKNYQCYNKFIIQNL